MTKTEDVMTALQRLAEGAGDIALEPARLLRIGGDSSLSDWGVRIIRLRVSPKTGRELPPDTVGTLMVSAEYPTPLTALAAALADIDKLLDGT